MKTINSDIAIARTLQDFQVWDADESVPQEKHSDGALCLKGTRDRIMTCTTSATYIAAQIGAGAKVVGFSYETLEENGVPSSDWPKVIQDHDGHDFVVVDGRFIVDWWAKFVAGDTERVAFDMQDPQDAEYVRRYYGTPDMWQGM